MTIATKEEILETVLSLAGDDLATVNGAKLAAATKLDDIPTTGAKNKALDSLLTSLESKYIGVTFPKDVRAYCKTVGGVVDFIFENQDG